jgi:hypothetical protein
MKWTLAFVLLFLLVVSAQSTSFETILTDVDSGSMQLAVTVDEATMPVLPQTLTKQQVLDWLNQGWLTVEPTEFEKAPDGGNCHLIYANCGSGSYCIYCADGGGARRCPCSEANLS